jgi:hypothetical protein
LNQGLPPLTGAPRNETVRKPGFVPRLVNRFLPHPSGTDKTGSDTDKTGAGTDKTGAGTDKTGSETKKTRSETKKTRSETKKARSESRTSTGAHSGGGSAA